MRVSVVIACFNERETIEQVVRAVRESTIPDLEIIVVDAGSTDGSADVSSFDSTFHRLVSAARSSLKNGDRSMTSTQWSG